MSAYMLGPKKSSLQVKKKLVRKREVVAEIWCDWNMKTIDGNEAMHRIGGVFRASIKRAWKQRVKDQLTEVKKCGSSQKANSTN